MTREEAIQVLTDIKRIRSDEISEAIDMAIEALSVANLKEEFESAECEDYEHATLVDIKEPLKVVVVRCKDCVWSKEWNDNQIFCDRILMRLRETDFCSYGEGREPTE